MVARVCRFGPSSLAEAFDATGNALRDAAVQADVREAGRLFVDAIAATIAVVSGEAPGIR
jgi:hypothetical protein